MFVYLLTAPLLVVPICISFARTSAGRAEIVPPWFTGLGAGVLLVLIETAVRLPMELTYTSSLLFLQLAAAETTVPIALAVALFFALSRDYRSADPPELELGLASFLSGAFTTRAIYHALYIADSASVYWSFLSPTIMVSAIFLVPSLVALVRSSERWRFIGFVAALIVLLFAYTAVPLLHSLRFQGLAVLVAAAFGVGGVAAWVLRPVLSRADVGRAP